MEVKNKKVVTIPIEDIFKVFDIKVEPKKCWIYYSSVKDSIQIEIPDEV